MSFKPKTINLIQLNTAVLMFGLTAMFAKGIPLSVWHIICFRSIVCAIALFLYMRALKVNIGVKKPKHYAVMAFLGILLCGHWLTYFQALKVSSAAVANFALQTHPVITALVEPVVFREKLKKIDLALAALVFIGILIMTPTMSLSDTTTLGIVLGVVSGVLWMVRSLMTRKYVQVYSGSTMMFWQALVTGLVLIPVLFAVEPAEYTPRTIGLLVLLGVVFTALPQTLIAASFKNLSARTVGVISTLLPFYAAFFAYFIHHETVTPRTAAGGLVILFAVVVETVRSVQTKPAPVPAQAVS